MSDAFCVTSRLPLRICIFPSFPTAFIMKSDAFIPPFKVFLSHPISHWLLPGSLPPAKQTTLIFFIYSHGFSPMTLLTYCSPCPHWLLRNLCVSKYMWPVLQDLVKVPLPSHHPFPDFQLTEISPSSQYWRQLFVYNIEFIAAYTVLWPYLFL